MEQLKVGVLAVCSCRTPDDKPGIVIDFFTISGDTLTITLHVRLLQIRGQVLEVLVIGNNRLRVSAEEVVIPDTQQTQNDRDVLLQRCCPEVFVHRMCTGEKLCELVIANSQSNRQTNRRPQ